ncbi:hypothetical protein [Dietzia timorensis]|uniref:Uncharacterized protein n=1 Tax=Dietzia timorensis TaxID=499555 RepID=A0A173LNF3_9ACTN|nr:hypothetical protein [Dietzia timorensis]ANI93433.1 Hypothetical protein BJL86_2673 [Dietzia timorensis]
MSDEPRVPQSEEARRAREAREALIAKEAAADEAAASGRETGKPPVPVWYLLFLAVVVLVLFGRNAFGERTGLDSLLALVFALVLALFVGVLVYRMTSKSPSHTGGRSAWRPSLGAAALAAVFPVVATLLDGPLGTWVWLVCGVGLAAFLVWLGVRFARVYRRR